MTVRGKILPGPRGRVTLSDKGSNPFVVQVLWEEGKTSVKKIYVKSSRVTGEGPTTTHWVSELE